MVGDRRAGEGTWSEWSVKWASRRVDDGEAWRVEKQTERRSAGGTGEFKRTDGSVRTG